MNNRHIRTLVVLATAAGLVAGAHTAEAVPMPKVVICKSASGPGVTGSFTFTIDDGGTPKTASVAVGGCSGEILLSGMGTVSVTEAPKSNIAVTSITAAGNGTTLVNSDPPNRKVTFVTATQAPWVTTVTFVNKKVPVCCGGGGTIDFPVKESGIVKVCKVAGPGVAVGTNFSFKVGANVPVVVPAGPAPGGYCNLLGTFGVGSTITVTEAAVSGTQVTGISAEPSSRLVSSNLPARTASVKVGTGVTEVTYTNAKVVAEKTGYIEICKAAESPTQPIAFQFAVTGVSGLVTVPAGACSAAIQVPAGSVTITEQLVSGWMLASCSAVPNTAFGSCSPSTGTMVINVPTGGISQQVIANLTNVPRH
jgi:hypothetical protein